MDQVRRRVLIQAAQNLLVLLPPVSWVSFKTLSAWWYERLVPKRMQLHFEKNKITLNKEIRRVYSSVSARGIIRWENWAIYVTRVGGGCRVGRKIILECVLRN